MDSNMVQVTRSVVQTGLQKSETETVDSLSKDVAKVLSDSGETVTAQDFTACYRNGQTNKKNAKGKDIPPSITVKFHNITISKRDKIVLNYSNYDSVKKTQRPVKVFQSYHNFLLDFDVKF